MKKIKTFPDAHLPFHTLASLQDRLLWLINLRWIAVMGMLISVPIAREVLKFQMAFSEITNIAALVISINIIYFFIVRYYKFKNEYDELYFAELQIIVDLILTSFLVHYSGGIANPFYFLYIVQVILSGILFPGIVLPYLNAVLAALILTAWTLAAHFNIISDFNLREESISLPFLIVSLSAFYITNFAGIYIINNFMRGYRTLKSIIDDKNIMLEQSIKDRNKTFRYAAHELKSPAIAIQSSLAVVEALYFDQLQPEARDLILKAENRSSQVIDMIKEMITITQYNLGMEKPDYQDVDINEWTSNLLKQYHSNAIKKKINLTFRPSAKNIFITIDAAGLEKVLNNLVTNALRYTPDNGSVRVECFIDSGTYGFKVIDTGIGIDQKDIPKLFDEFYRGKNAREMEKIGTGLGLNLVKEIVEINKGAIFIKSELGKGTEFMVEFPLSGNTERTIIEEEEIILNFE